MDFLARFRTDTGGAAAAEMALMLPLLVVLLFVTFEGGYFMWNQHIVTKAVRDGARFAGRQDFSNFNACPAVAGTLVTQVQVITKTGKLTGGTAKLPGTYTINVSCTDNSGFKTGLYKDRANGGTKVIVKAKVGYKPLFSQLGVFKNTFSLNATAESPVMGI